jgi:hypothetical protein
MSIPLINEVNKNDINTSIIAIKKDIERINTLLGLNNTEEIDTSIFATKEELEQAKTDLAPVDEVTVDNMQSVTSNAVAEKFNSLGITKVTYGSVRLETGTHKTKNIDTGLTTLRHISISPSSNAGAYPTWYITRSYEATPTVQITYTNSGSNAYLNWMAFGD